MRDVIALTVSEGTLRDCEREWMRRHARWVSARTRPTARGAPQPANAGRGRPWTQRELDEVEAHWGRVPRTELEARLPGRTWERICRQASRLGIIDRPVRNLLSRQAACAVLRCDWRTLAASARQNDVRLHRVHTRPSSVYATPRAWARCYARHCRAWMDLSEEAERRVFDAAYTRLVEAQQRLPRSGIVARRRRRVVG